MSATKHEGKTKMKTKEKPVWKVMGGLSGNEILDFDGFFISYLPPGGFGISMFAADGDGGETALVVMDGGANKVSGNSYYILNGDWRKDYEKVAQKGLKACMDFYKRKKRNHGSSWSQE